MIVKQLGRLGPQSVSAFKHHAFDPAVPVLLSKGAFTEFPAIKSWFTCNANGEATINPTALLRAGDPRLPLERTTFAAHENNTVNSFERFDAPLSLFLQWLQQTQDDALDASQVPDPSRLYLAQARILDLPRPLQNDLPTPELVRKSGRGDIYDSSIWIGLAPTYTPLHRDPNPNLFVQLAGRKTVRLVDPVLGAQLFSDVQRAIGGSASAAHRGSEMMDGAERDVLQKIVWDTSDGGDSQLSWLEGQVDAGDAIFIPQGWWHSVRGSGEGVIASVNWWFR